MYSRLILDTVGGFTTNPVSILVRISRYSLHSKFLNNDNSYMMTWGKHKGKTLKQISRMDPGYIDYLRRSEFVIEKCPKLLKELN
ncbi:unnamed protein product [Phytophthora lilii]|uniref:Unnamed protein product n=1 Tax=Phytophthora lilii TaxID=2077276 RepID=A0A9W6U5T7_9STRA|nr:unnamed protein product [Phytophthora lilii]